MCNERWIVLRAHHLLLTLIGNDVGKTMDGEKEVLVCIGAFLVFLILVRVFTKLRRPDLTCIIKCVYPNDFTKISFSINLITLVIVFRLLHTKRTRRMPGHFRIARLFKRMLNMLTFLNTVERR